MREAAGNGGWLVAGEGKRGGPGGARGSTGTETRSLSADSPDGSGKAVVKISERCAYAQPRNQSLTVNLPDSPERMTCGCKSWCALRRDGGKYARNGF